jgi:hypothetical protein
MPMVTSATGQGLPEHRIRQVVPAAVRGGEGDPPGMLRMPVAQCGRPGGPRPLLLPWPASAAGSRSPSGMLSRLCPV